MNKTSSFRRIPSPRRARTEWSLILLTAALSLFGVLIISSSSRFEYQPVSFANHMLHVALGAAVLIGLSFFDCTKLEKHPGWLYAAGVLLPLYCLFFGAEAEGVRRWLRLGAFAVSVNAASCALLPVAFCGFLSRLSGRGYAAIAGLMLLALCSLLPFLVQPSMGTAFLLLAVYGALLVRAAMQRRFGGDCSAQLPFALALLALSVLAALALPIFLRPGGAALAGFGAAREQIAELIRSAAAIGPSPHAQSADRIIPELATDFAPLNVVIQFGWLAGLALCALFGVLIARLALVSRRAVSAFGSDLSFAAMLMLALPFCVSVLISLGLIPCIDVALPFVAYGGTHYLSCMAYVGLALAVWRRGGMTV